MGRDPSARITSRPTSGLFGIVQSTRSLTAGFTGQSQRTLNHDGDREEQRHHEPKLAHGQAQRIATPR